MVEIDGSYGEGGGQILRTSISLSALLKEPFHINNIRKNRKKPGLMPQHLMAVKATAEICGAKVKGAVQGSGELTFEPGKAFHGNFSFDIGTAGSTSLLFQTLLLPLIHAGGGSTLELTGGTHVPMSPPFDYIKEVFLPTLARMGVKTSCEIKSYGFYPRGGGLVRFRIEPVKEIFPGGFTERGKLKEIKIVSAVCGLPLSIARRQTDSVLGILAGYEVNILTESLEVNSFSGGRGTYIFILAIYENIQAGFSAVGERGKRAEAVGAEAAYDFLMYDRAGSSYALDRHLADQIVLYLALARGESAFTTPFMTEHLLTNLWAMGKFLKMDYRLEGQKDGPGKVEVKVA